MGGFIDKGPINPYCVGMSFSKASTVTMRVLMVIMAGVSILTGVFVGLSSAMASNLGSFEDFNASVAALPSQVFDIKGRKITEFFSSEKRDLVKIQELPPHLVYALITREDQDFFNHPGFSIKGFARAAVGVVTGRNLGGGSTITQQLAGTLYADRSDKSYLRKIRELWYSIQLERQWTKQQILEEYMNKMYFGHGTYGVEAASQFFFGHSARQITVAESAILVIQLAGAGLYSPLRYAERAKKMQLEILNQMVALGYVDKAEADASFADYWSNYDLTRSPDQTVFFARQDLAPYFSEYVRNELNNNWLLGEADINRDGFKIHTTLDLDFQNVARELMTEGITKANKTFRTNRSGKSKAGADVWVPIVDVLSLTMDIPSIRVGDTKQINDARSHYRHMVNPLVDLMGLSFATTEDPSLSMIAQSSRLESQKVSKRNTVEGALITLDNETGYILAMIGGSRFEQTNQLNRAIQARVQPGSAFKPMYYAAAIETGTATAATRYYDSPVEFPQDDGSIYTPLNYNGVWEGPVLVRRALMKSMNIPSIKLLNAVGFDDAISISTRLMGIPPSELTRRGFGRVYSLGLGVVSVSPLEIARGFSAFPRLGRATKEIGIKYIIDRNDKIVVEPEREILREINNNGGFEKVISPQSAFIMADMLSSTVTEGTLASSVRLAKGLPMQMAGKTGTTQNWADAWAVGFSAYFTTAVWFGFDEGGTTNSLGTNQTGAALAGPVWARYMKAIHEGLKPRSLPQPGNGLVRVTVTNNAGLLPPPDYTGPTHVEIFKVGTEPKDIDLDAVAQIENAETRIKGTELPPPPVDLFQNEAPVGLDPEAQRVLDELGLGSGIDNEMSDPFSSGNYQESVISP